MTMAKKRRKAASSSASRKRPAKARASVRPEPKPAPAPEAPASPAAPTGKLFPIVGIGASAGGLEAYTQLLRALPADTGMAFVLVQHLDPTHESLLTELLSSATDMPVTQVSDSVAVLPNHVYVI